MQTLYGRVLVPLGVLEEMSRTRSPVDVQRWASNPPAWIEAVSVPSIDPSLAPGLGLGECQAISLALRLGADLLLIDDRAGREEATARNLSVTGALAILIEAAVRGSCELPAALSTLKRLGFRMSPELERYAMERLRQRKPRAD